MSEEERRGRERQNLGKGRKIVYGWGKLVRIRCIKGGK
jgi:hypothetical protein